MGLGRRDCPLLQYRQDQRGKPRRGRAQQPYVLPLPLAHGALDDQARRRGADAVGHNDSGPLDDPARARGTLPGNGEETRQINNPITRKPEVVHTYGWYLRQMIEETREKRATPIVLSLIPRKIWKDGKIRCENYVQWAWEAAQQEHALFVNLNEIVAEQYDAMGPQAVDRLFGDPHTHTNLAGAKLNAKSVIEGLKGLKRDPLKRYFSKDGRRVKMTFFQMR